MRWLATFPSRITAPLTTVAETTMTTRFKLAIPIVLWIAASAGAIERPNVVLFLVDDMGWMDSTPYGSQYYETPNMKRLERQSMRFTVRTPRHYARRLAPRY